MECSNVRDIAYRPYTSVRVRVNLLQCEAYVLLLSSPQISLNLQSKLFFTDTLGLNEERFAIKDEQLCILKMLLFSKISQIKLLNLFMYVYICILMLPVH